VILSERVLAEVGDDRKHYPLQLQYFIKAAITRKLIAAMLA
jgi:hypothetical protein